MKAKLILVGGGLANSLIAHRVLIERPDFPLLVVERGASLGADHTWSFHDSDLTDDQRRWIAPLVAHHWAISAESARLSVSLISEVMASST